MARNPRILIYSHDTFGLGHLRRCQAIAHSLVSEIPGLSVLILSGSPIIGSFDFKARVDFVRIPGVIKLRNGEYTSLNLHLDIEETLKLRASIIEHTAEVFQPDIFLVDKEPLGLRGEVENTIHQLRASGTRIVLGLRDVLDDPGVLYDEWQRKNAFEAVEKLYDEVWVYGLENIYDPLTEQPLSERVRKSVSYTGYLHRSVPKSPSYEALPFAGEPFILVTPGGGGDGIELVDWVFKCYEAHLKPLYPALIVLGPFMPPEKQNEFFERSENLRHVEVVKFTPRLEAIMAEATAVVGMGGYNTFCEILSFDKPTLLVPRVEPRREQAIRAERASGLGLVRMQRIDDYPDLELMTDALADLPHAPRPSESPIGGLLEGLPVLNRMVGERLPPAPAEAAE